MTWEVSAKDRDILRALAEKQAEYAALPVMKEREQMFYDMTDGEPGARPPFIVEASTFDADFMHGDVFKCETETGRWIEDQLLRNVLNHERINDDKVIPGTYDVAWFMDINHVGIDLKRHTAKDSRGEDLGYSMEHPIKDLRTDMDVIKSPTCKVDREKTESYIAFVKDLVGDILPIRHTGRVPAWTGLTSMMIKLMGMEAFYMAMYDAPDEVHQAMGKLRDNSLATMKWAEEEGLLIVNNGNDISFGTSFNFTNQLPVDGYDGGPARLCDMWASAESQETVGISPDMFGEFCAPYYREICEPLGFIYWGCCEPANPLWEHIKTIPHLKKVSISRWADEKVMGDALRGTNITYSRKPDPRFMGIDKTLDEDGWAEHVRDTLEATRDGVSVEFVYRDVYTLNGELDKPKRIVEIARREIDKYYS